MNADDFRELALSLPEAEEKSHMGHPDFRVGGKIFATLEPDEQWGMLKLIPAQQSGYVRRNPEIFQAIAGGWGRHGATRVELKQASASTVRQAMEEAWRNTAPKRLLNEVDSHQRMNSRKK